MRMRSHTFMLTAVTLIALAIHGTFFIALNGMEFQISYPYHQRPLIYDHTILDSETYTENLQQEQLDKELAQIFQNLNDDPQRPQPSEAMEIENLTADIQQPDTSIIITSSEELDFSSPKSLGEPLPTLPDIDINTALEKDISSIESREDLPLDTNDTEIAQELINAAETVLYNLEPSEAPFDNEKFQAAQEPLDLEIEELSSFLKEAEIDPLSTAPSSPALSNIDDTTEYLFGLGDTETNNTIPILLPKGESSQNIDLSHLEHLPAVANTANFDLSVEYFPDARTGLNYFRLIFKPQKEAAFKRIRQNYFFLIDRSNSITKKRYHYNRQAVSQSLDFLSPGDTFNILVFDDEVVSLSENNLSWTPSNVAEARQFLQALPHGGMFASTELYSSLDEIIPPVVEDAEVNTAILLSDGDTVLRPTQQRQTIADWTKENQGKISLFSIASGNRNNLPLLDVLCAFNKGKMIYVDQHSKVPDALSSLIQTLKNPIGKDILATIVLPDQDTKIMLYPRSSRLPDLYQDRPYVIHGTSNSSSPFHIFLQGKYYDQWLDIKKTIDFQEAVISSQDIKRDCSLHHAYDYYAKFLSTGNLTFLRQARQILEPLNLESAFK
ncbi:MAG: hypothetical protein ACQEP8_02275 [Chlamydiota bacterium]